MIRKSFNSGWEVSPYQGMLAMLHPSGASEALPVTLPYDDMLRSTPTPEAPAKAATGYYPNKVCMLKKSFEVPAEWEDKSVLLEFEGVYANGAVYINEDYAGGCLHGYTNFYVEANRFLKYGETNVISVIARTSEDTRWYSGVGAYRNVKIMVSDPVHIVPDSYRITTPEVDTEGAMVVVALQVVNTTNKTVTTSITTTLTDAEGNAVAQQEATLTSYAGETQTLRQRIYVENVKRWDIDTPYLYTASSVVSADGKELDRDESAFGVRTLQVDPRHGLRINGKTVKLRGACVHHDNGLIGAAAIERAEERRVELLKAAGFNAVRSAHNPISKAFLTACDKYGVVVMDEISDMWTRNKTACDFATEFPLMWETLCERIVGKNFNHPSVIMYSIGNEIPETGSANGADIGRKLAEKVRSLDSTRYVVNSINTMLSVMDKLAGLMADKVGTEINETMTNAGDMMAQLNDSEIVTNATKESYDVLDICGYNYATSRYALDKKLFPHRVLVGSETKPMQIAENWAEIMKYDHAIGDFTWTGWDYIGEAGIGKMEYAEDGATPGFMGEYPWRIGYCGDIDITGLRRPMSYLREIVFGLRTEPYVAVDYPWNYGKTLLDGMWNSFDGIGSWSWKGYEGKPVCVNVFGVGDSFTLLCNGKEIGKGELKEFRGKADVTYEAGELVAVTYQGGTETGRTVLHSAQGDVRLVLKPDRTEIRADDTDLAYVEVQLCAANGEIDNMENRRLKASVTGAGTLLGFGTGKPKCADSFLTGEYDSFDGRAMAVIRPTGEGSITLTVKADGMADATVTITAQ